MDMIEIKGGKKRSLSYIKALDFGYVLSISDNDTVLSNLKSMLYDAWVGEYINFNTYKETIYQILITNDIIEEGDRDKFNKILKALIQSLF